MIFCTFNFSPQQQNHGIKDEVTTKRNKTMYLNSLVEKIQHENMDAPKDPWICLEISVNINHVTGQLGQWFGSLKIT